MNLFTFIVRYSQKVIPRISEQHVMQTSPYVDPTVSTSVAITLETQYLTAECIDLLTDKEGIGDLSHTSRGSADTDHNFAIDKVTKAFKCIVIGHQEILSV